jgi:hypothetical protein
MILLLITTFSLKLIFLKQIKSCKFISYVCCILLPLGYHVLGSMALFFDARMARIPMCCFSSLRLQTMFFMMSCHYLSYINVIACDKHVILLHPNLQITETVYRDVLLELCFFIYSFLGTTCGSYMVSTYIFITFLGL